MASNLDALTPIGDMKLSLGIWRWREAIVQPECLLFF